MDAPTPPASPHRWIQAKGMSLRSGRDEWWTPPHIIEAARHALGGRIDLDPASIDGANEVVQATRFFTRETDGLQEVWSGRLWLNPPFSVSVIGQFVSKLLTEPDVSAWVALTNNCTETRWGQKLLSHAHVVCFPGSRLAARTLLANKAPRFRGN